MAAAANSYTHKRIWREFAGSAVIVNRLYTNNGQAPTVKDATFGKLKSANDGLFFILRMELSPHLFPSGFPCSSGEKADASEQEKYMPSEHPDVARKVMMRTSYSLFFRISRGER
jgi:hypothetical protein